MIPCHETKDPVVLRRNREERERLFFLFGEELLSGELEIEKEFRSKPYVRGSSYNCSILII